MLKKTHLGNGHGHLSGQGTLGTCRCVKEYCTASHPTCRSIACVAGSAGPGRLWLGWCRLGQAGPAWPGLAWLGGQAGPAWPGLAWLSQLGGSKDASQTSKKTEVQMIPILLNGTSIGLNLSPTRATQSLFRALLKQQMARARSAPNGSDLRVMRQGQLYCSPRVCAARHCANKNR